MRKQGEENLPLKRITKNKHFEDQRFKVKETIDRHQKKLIS